MGLNFEKYYFGILCPRNHNYKNTGNSLRFKSNGRCWQCACDDRRRYENLHPEKRVERQKRFYKNNPGACSRYVKTYQEKHAVEIRIAKRKRSL